MPPLNRESALCCWLQQGQFGRYLTQITQNFMADKLSRMPLPTVLQLGSILAPLTTSAPPWCQYLLQTSSAATAAADTDVVAAYAALPWAAQSIQTVVWPHGLEVCATAAPAVLRELHRILVPGGQVLLTGLNALGYWRLWHGHTALLQGVRYHSAPSVQRLLLAQGFSLSEAQFMGYRVHTAQYRPEAAAELMGNRWWPHLAALYGCVYTKQHTVLTPLPQAAPVLGKRGNLGWEAATQHDCAS